MEAWFGTSTVASLAQPSGVGESSGNEGSGDTLTVQQPDVAWGPKTCGALLRDPPPSKAQILGARRTQVLQWEGGEALRREVWGEGAGERRGGLVGGGGTQRRREGWAWT